MRDFIAFPLELRCGLLATLRETLFGRLTGKKSTICLPIQLTVKTYLYEFISKDHLDIRYTNLGNHVDRIDDCID